MISNLLTAIVVCCVIWACFAPGLKTRIALLTVAVAASHLHKVLAGKKDQVLR